MISKKRTIKVTENQLRETEGEAFKYIDADNNYSPYNGQTEISVSGNMDGENEGQPITGDQIAQQLTPQSYTRYRMYGNLQRHTMRESDENNDGVDDFYNNTELDTLSNGDDSDDITKVPESVIRKLNILMDSMQNLRVRQQAMILNKLIENFDFSQLPSSWKKELMKKINVGQLKSNEQIS